jgi:Insertion element 4 transposase N-terminal
MRLLVEGLAWARRWQGNWQVPDKSSIARARARLGPAPLWALLVEVARPLATRKTKGAWYRGWRLVALDGTTLDVPDTPANVAAFGRPGGGRGQGAVLQVRLVGLVKCGTHGVVDAAMGGLHLGEGSLAPSLRRSLGPGMLLPVDQGLCGLELWRTFHATGAELVWRCRQDVTLEVLEVLPTAPGQASWAPSPTPKASASQCGSSTTAWTIPAALASRKGIGSSPRSWIPSGHPRRSCRRCIRSGGSWRPRWTNSRPTSAALGWCCAAQTPTGSGRRSGRICWSTTPRRLARATRQAVAEALRHLLPPHQLPMRGYGKCSSTCDDRSTRKD